MQSSAKTVGAYLKEADPTRRPVLKRFRKLFQEVLTDCDEEMNYGMATYMKDGELVTAFANQKGYIALYAGRSAIAKYKKNLAGIDCGKGCIRYRRLDQIDFSLVRSLLKHIVARHLSKG